MKEQSVSVAIATYNGEKYLEEQLVSILRQTRPVQEIVISDDGSKDNTLAVAHRVAESPEADGVRFILLQDNPRKGAGGNFEWAMSHCSGDIIFVCGQDDVWLTNKVEAVLVVFEQNEDALCVIHDALHMDSFGEITDQSIIHRPIREKFPHNIAVGDIVKFDKSAIEFAVSGSAVISGIALCLKKELFESSRPFPAYAEDQWIEFCAFLSQRTYYINDILAYYRRHNTNLSGRSATKIERLKKRINRIVKSNSSTDQFLFTHDIATRFKEELAENNMQNTEEYRVANAVLEVGEAKKKALERGGIIGATQLIRLYCNNTRYKKTGFKPFIYDVLLVFSASR